MLTTGCPPFLRPVVVGRERVARGCCGGAGGGGGGARAGPAAGRAARRSGPAPALAPFPVQGRSSLWTVSCCWGGWLVLLLRGCNACRAVGGGLQSGAALIGVRLDVGSLPPRSSSLTVTGCRLCADGAWPRSGLNTTQLPSILCSSCSAPTMGNHVPMILNPMSVRSILIKKLGTAGSLYTCCKTNNYC